MGLFLSLLDCVFFCLNAYYVYHNKHICYIPIGPFLQSVSIKRAPPQGLKQKRTHRLVQGTEGCQPGQYLCRPALGQDLLEQHGDAHQPSCSS
eukprot:jgi/Botrbrau1/13887/Bobra.0056s0118.1